MLSKKLTSVGSSSQRRDRNYKLRIFTSARLPLMVAMLVPGVQSVHAQQAGEELVEEVVITGSRVIRDGFQAPTPTTVMGTEAINDVAPLNIADAVNMLPSLAGGSTPRTGSGGLSGGGTGMNTLNLRALGTDRTLVLLDGQRIVPQALSGTPDVNQFPDSLVRRVEVVTGGASAAYGSGAVAGVVNFILDKDFTGVKTELMGGVTAQGDDEQFKLTTTAGIPFANERGHFLISGEISDKAGVDGMDRSWYNAWKPITNPDYTPTNGQPEIIRRPHVGYSGGTPGALITDDGPLRGIEFIEGGAMRQFDFGYVSGLLHQGGDWERSDRGAVPDLTSGVERMSIFTRASYGLTDNVEGYVQISRAESTTSHTCCSNTMPNLLIQHDNAFLPDAITSQMAASGISSFRAGTSLADTGDTHQENTRTVTNFVVGVDGDFGAFGRNWDWDAYVQRGISTVKNRTDLINRVRFTQAIDAVTDPSGNIVCRSTLTNPGDGCVPYNIFGIGMNDQNAIDYVKGIAWLNQEFQMDIFAANVRGEPFSTWAGVVSVAAGLEHRIESIDSEAAPEGINNEFWAANFKPTIGEYDISELYLETVVPLASGVAWAESLEMNAAIRLAEYSTAGRVDTWKIGFTYAPTSDLTFRGTRSLDIRAPNMNEVFLGGQVNTQTVIDPFNDNITVPILRSLSGNPNLNAEEADTLGLGFVYQPSFIPGFSMSVDYYDIAISGSISIVGQQPLIDRCFAGNLALCDSIIRNAEGTVVQVNVRPINVAFESAEGIDFEARYGMQLGEGDLSFRLLGTHIIAREDDDSVAPARDLAGQGNNAEWRWFGTVGYNRGPLSLRLMGRYISEMVVDTRFIECRTNCPSADSLAPGARTIEDNGIDSVFYTDASVSYELFGRGGAWPTTTQLFLRVDNLMDKAPPVTATALTGIPFAATGVNPSLHDMMGRSFRAGLRIDW